MIFDKKEWKRMNKNTELLLWFNIMIGYKRLRINPYLYTRPQILINYGNQS
jgi:hypothetical protein